jgi:selenocysteine lyase/cysteine desulfurase
MNGVIDLVNQRVRTLMEYTISSLSRIHYKNGTPIVTIHGGVEPSQRGGSLALTFYSSNGNEVACEKVDILATKERISLRSGCMCNPAMTGILIHQRKTVSMIEQNVTFSELLVKAGKNSMGVVRISFGLASNQKDADAFINFVKSLAKNELLD